MRLDVTPDSTKTSGPSKGGIDEFDDNKTQKVHERLSDAFYLLDEDLRFKYINKKAVEFLGKEKEELLGEELCECFPETVGSIFYEKIQEATEDVSPVSFDLHCDSTEKWFHVNLYPSQDGISVYFREMEQEETGAETAVERTTLEKNELPLCVISPEKEIKYVNGSYQELVGCHGDEVVGKNLKFLCNGCEDTTVFQKLNAGIAEEETTEVEGVCYRKDGEPFWCHVTASPLYREDERLQGYLLTLRDVTDRQSKKLRLARRRKILDTINEGIHDMYSADTAEEVESAVVESTSEIFGEAVFYRWEDGSLHSNRSKIEDGRDSPAWEAFTRDEFMVTKIEDGEEVSTETHSKTDIENRWSFEKEYLRKEEGDGSVEIRLDIPVGKQGILCVHSDYFCEHAKKFLGSIVAAAETSFRSVEKEELLRQLNHKLESQNEELRRLSEIGNVVRETMTKVVGADSQDSIEESFCENLLEIEGWEFGWFVEKDSEGLSVRHECEDGESSFSDRLIRSVEGSPLSESLKDGEVRITDDVARSEATEWRKTVLDEGFLSVATVPVTYGSREFGVFEVYSTEPDSFSGEYSETLVDVAEIIGYALTSTEQVESILSGGFSQVTLSIEFEDVDCFFSRLVEETGEEFRINAIVPGKKDTVVYFKTGADESKIREIADEKDVGISETMNGFEAAVSDMSVVEQAMNLSGRVSRYSPGGNQLLVDIDLPQENEVRKLIDMVVDEHPSVELVAQKSEGEAEMSSMNPLRNLTERQETVLRLAYESGFFESPRKKTGEELAESIGITSTTFHQHLRSAEKRLLESVIGSDK